MRLNRHHFPRFGYFSLVLILTGPEVSDTSDQCLDPGSESDADDNIWPLVRGTIDFSAYKEFKLHPIKNVELPEVGADGDVSWWGLYALYEIALNDDWRTREGGILRAVAEYDDFFSCMLSYNSSSPGWAGVVKWDTLFEKLHNSGYRKNIIPCMVRVPNYAQSPISLVTIAATVFWPEGWMPRLELPIPP
jgi:hypothetical protein